MNQIPNNNAINDFKDVLICGEAAHKKISSVTSELLRTGRELSDKLDSSLHVLIIGKYLEEAAAQAVALGANVVHLADSAPFEESLPEFYVQICAEVCGQLKPRMVLFGQTDMGRDIAPRLAGRLDVSICLDCVNLEVDPESLSILQTKPVYGGNALAVWEANDRSTQIVTIRPRIVNPADFDGSRQGEILPVPAILEEPKIKEELLRTVKEDSKGVRLEDAKVIVAGGGGIGGKEGFRLLEELAQTIRAAIGTSRVPCDEGWMPKNLEIGQTGHMVSPDVYIAVGISGAPQHLAGCSGSKCIVAINRDREAHIFKESDLGLVGDYREALPSLIEKLKSIFNF
jgi:electron transfer flavoprotein alpha subunit